MDTGSTPVYSIIPNIPEILQTGGFPGCFCPGIAKGAAKRLHFCDAVITQGKIIYYLRNGKEDGSMDDAKQEGAKE